MYLIHPKSPCTVPFPFILLSGLVETDLSTRNIVKIKIKNKKICAWDCKNFSMESNLLYRLSSCVVCLHGFKMKKLLRMFIERH